MGYEYELFTNNNLNGKSCLLILIFDKFNDDVRNGYAHRTLVKRKGKGRVVSLPT